MAVAVLVAYEGVGDGERACGVGEEGCNGEFDEGGCDEGDFCCWVEAGARVLWSVWWPCEGFLGGGFEKACVDDFPAEQFVLGQECCVRGPG